MLWVIRRQERPASAGPSRLASFPAYIPATGNAGYARRSLTPNGQRTPSTTCPTNSAEGEAQMLRRPGTLAFPVAYSATEVWA